MTESLPFPLPSCPDVIRRRRALILSALCGLDGGFACIPVRSMQPQTLRRLLELYDELFFDHFLLKSYGQIDVTLSARLTSAAGKFVYARSPEKRLQKAEIRMSSDFLLRLNEGPFQLNGLSVATPQEAFLIVFEHELCHAAETALFGKTGHSERFLSLANGLFGHTQTHHSLPTRRSGAAKEGLLVGMQASFPYEGKTLTGVISFIGKTATIMVPSARGGYRDKRGRRYAKYRVPLALIQKN